MNFNHDPEAKLNVYGGILIENTRANLNTALPRSMIRRQLLEQLAATLASDAVTVTETKYTKEHRLQVYVLTSDQLEKYVQRRAEELHPSMPSPRWLDYAPTNL